MQNIPPAFGTWNLAVISEPKRGQFEGNPVVNFRAAIVAGLFGRKIVDQNNNEIYAQVEAQNYFDVAVWDESLMDAALSLKVSQKVAIAPRTVTPGKPYTDKDGNAKSSVKLTVAELTPGPMPTRRATTAPAAATSQFAADPLEDPIPF